MNTSGDRDWERAWRILRQAIAQHAFPGASAAITLGDDVVALCGFGRFTYEHHAPEVSGETSFDLSSLTKEIGRAHV